MDANPSPYEDSPVTQGAIRPQSPVIVIGRTRRFLDVRPTIEDAEQHVAVDHADVAIGLDACDFYDGIARPLKPVLREDGTVSFELVPREPKPDELRRRVNDLLRWALQSHDPATLYGESALEDGDLEPLPSEYSFARFLDTLDRRFNGDTGGPRHVGGRLHNFWHAVLG